jgi:hypothetical protein
MLVGQGGEVRHKSDDNISDWEDVGLIFLEFRHAEFL